MELKVKLIGHIVLDYISIGGKTSGPSIGGGVTYGGLALASYGVKPVIVSNIGVDFPEEYIELFKSLGINTMHIHRFKNYKTTSYHLIYDEQFNRKLILKSLAPSILPSDMGIANSHDFNITIVSPVACEIPYDTLRVASYYSDLVALDVQGIVRECLVNAEVKLRNLPLEEVAQLLKLVDIIHADVNEAKALLSIDDPIEIIKRLLSISGGRLKVVLLTFGIDGGYVGTKHKVYYVPSFVTKTVNPTGAGDVYLSIFTVEYYKSRNVIHAASMAAAAVSYIVESTDIYRFPNRGKTLLRASNVMKRIEEVH